MKPLALIKVLIVVTAFFWILSLLSQHHYDIMCLFDSRTYTGEQIPNEENVLVNDTVYISGLGDFDESDLEIASKAINDVFGLICKKIPPTSASSNLYSENGKLDAKSCSMLLNTANKTVYVTNEYVVSNGKIVCGSSTFTGNFVIVSDNFNNHVRNTTLHEMAHTLGADHCDNQCIMGHIELGEPNGEFCYDCKRQLGLL
jgi:predicted Zn-dependent protease